MHVVCLACVICVCAFVLLPLSVRVAFVLDSCVCCFCFLFFVLGSL